MLVWLLADETDGSTADRPTPQPRPDDKPTSSPDGVEPQADEEHAAVGDEINAMFGLLLPWAISVLLHLGVVLLAFFVVWSAAVEDEEETIIPETKLNDAPSEVLVESQDLEVTATSDVPREIETETVTKADPLSELTTETSKDLALIGVTGDKALPAGANFGNDDFGVGVYGLVGGNARTIVYCVDASGSLVDTLPFVIDELKTSLRNLVPAQRFAVVFFQENQALTPFRGMRSATPENVAAASNWMDTQVVPHGSSNPTTAITQALAYKPDLIYILSDNITGKGQYAVDQRELLELIETQKRSKGAQDTRINAIQFLYPDPLGTLKTVAEKHGGKYRFVDASVVGSR